MKYLLLVYASESNLDEAVFHANGETLLAGGYLLSALYLRSTAAASAVRLRDGECSLTDDPLVETQDQLAALYVINARDLNEAVRVAARLPQARQGLVEVRSMLDLDWLSE